MKARHLGLALCSALAASACGGSATEAKAPPSAQQPEAAVAQGTPDAPFRANEPPPDGEVQFTPPAVRKLALKNGIPVYLAERHDLPLVAVRVVVRGGASEARAGVAAMLGDMLEQGTKTRSAVAISDTFVSLGARHASYVGWDGGGVSVSLLAEHLPEAIGLIREIALEPSLPATELERLRNRRITALAQERSMPTAIASHAAMAAVYGQKTSYGTPLAGREADVRSITRADLLNLHRSLFAKGRLALVVAGDTREAEVMPLLEKAFGALKGPAAVGKTFPDPPAPKRAVALVEKPGAQSQIMLAGVGAPISTPDRDALRVMNAIFGGAFSSRVNLNLREKHAYTYGARSSFDFRRATGPFWVRASVVADKTVPALREMLAETERMRSSDVTEDELKMAKDYLKLSLPARFESVDDLAMALADLHVWELPADEFATRAARIEAVTAADVRRVAEKYLAPERWVAVVVGDRALQTELGGLGLGPVELRDAYGSLVGQ